jgi:hypothetical protein
MKHFSFDGDREVEISQKGIWSMMHHQEKAAEEYPLALLIYSSNGSSCNGGGRRGTGEDWIMVVVVEPYKRKQSRSRSS